MKPLQYLFIIAPLALLSLSSCNERSCENTMCENGGICLDGTCDCPEGFAGVHCHDRIPPDVIRITSMSVTRFPRSNGNVMWDPEDGPDIFFRLLDKEIDIGQPDYLVEDAMTSKPYNFIFHFIDINHPADTYKIQLLDYDGIDTKEDFMGEITFVPLDKSKDFPSTIILDDGGPIAFLMTVQYLYSNNGNR